MRTLKLVFLISVLAPLAALQPAHSAAQLPSYTLFESDPVTPMAMSSDGSRLFAVNTPDGTLEIFEPTSEGRLTSVGLVGVGLEPVALAVRNNSEVWVVNHLSDSVSIVDVASDPPRVTRTLLVGDEPRGIVFAGAGGNRAFIATAHRGQNTPWPDGDYDLPGTGRADIWVFNANNLGASLEGDPITVIQLFGDRPRALVASPDGTKVYAAVYRSGNRTVPIPEGVVCNGSGPCTAQGTSYPAGRPLPEQNIQNITSRETGIIVKYDEGSGQWRDENGNNWNNAVRFSLPDLDVFEIDADATTPFEIRSFSGVGTVLFNMLINPFNGNLYVTNTEAINQVRFEGLGDYVSQIGPKPSGDPPSVIGNLHQARVTVIDPQGNVTPRHLNKHIPYGTIPVPAGVKEKSLGIPLDMALSSDGTTLYVAGFGSNTIGVYNTAQLENDTFVPSAANMITTVEGPTGLVLDEARGFLWVLSRRTNGIYSVRLSDGKTTTGSGLYNPEPLFIKNGRDFLYDTQKTSSNGEASCASCHIFGDMDDLAWDLGDPDVFQANNPNPTPPTNEFPLLGFLPGLQDFDALKGPMTTQSLRGMKRAGPMHWRGDRTGPECSPVPSDPACANRAFNEFNVAFPGLIGRDEGELDPADMQAFTDFVLELTYPPNPIRALDNSLSPAAAAGKIAYGFDAQGNPVTFPLTDTVAACRGCHHLDRSQSFFGTAGFSTFENEPMEFKVAHLRNAYQKVGMFGQAPTNFFDETDGTFMGDQIRGTGFLHDGSVATVFNFLGASVFNLNDGQQRDLEAFIMEFDSELAPIVGQQTTVNANTGQEMLDRVDLLFQRADTTYYSNQEFGDVKECDLIAKGVVNDESRGFFYIGSNNFESDRDSEGLWTKTDILNAATQPGQTVTFTCVPPGSGERMGIDRDNDGFLDADDTQTCSASPMGAGHRSSLATLIFLLLSSLVVRRLRRVA